MAKIHPIIMPKWGMEMTEGNVARWTKAEGEKVARGDELLEIETDKIVNVYEAEFEGILRRRLVNEGTVHSVGSLLGIVAETAVPDSEIDSFIASYKRPSVDGRDSDKPSPQPAEPAASSVAVAEPPALTPAAPKAAPAARPGSDAAKVQAEVARLGEGISPVAARLAIRHGIDLTSVKGSGRLGRISLEDVEQVAGQPLGRTTNRFNASPVANRLARDKNIDLTLVRGSGPNGRILKSDVQSVIDRGLGGFGRIAAGPARFRAEPLSQMRKSIARRLTEAKSSIPHFYLTREIPMAALMDIRRQVNLRAGGRKLTVNDFLIKALGMALAEVPRANAQFAGDAIHLFDQSDVAVAIALDDGLVAPILRAVERKSVMQISDEVKELAARARTSRLTADDLQGGTSSLSNLGMFGVDAFNAIINPPQATIFAVGTISERPANVGGKLELAPMMSATLSCDHRVVDGALGAQLLAAFADLIENPAALIMGF